MVHLPLLSGRPGDSRIIRESWLVCAMLFYSAVRIDSVQSMTVSQSRKSLLLLFLTGLLVAVGAQRCQTTSLTKCVTDSISLPGNDPSSSMKRATWKAKYQDGDWIVAGHCVHLKGCTKHITVLPDGTRVRIGSNGSLIVERTSNQRNVTGKFQFLFDDLKRRHIFKVNFTVHCKFSLFVFFVLKISYLFLNVF